MLGPGVYHRQSLGMGVDIDKKYVGLAFLVLALAHGHGFGRRRAFVEHGGVGHFHAGQIHDHLLEVEQRFQPALGDFGLVGGISGVPARVFQHVAQNYRRHLGVVIAHADVVFEQLVLARDFFQLR